MKAILIHAVVKIYQLKLSESMKQTSLLNKLNEYNLELFSSVVNNHRQRSMKLWKNNENKRLNADVNEILV